MKTLQIITDPRCTEYASPGHPERPARISDSISLLKSQTELPLHWESPLQPIDTDALIRAHSKAHLHFIQAAEHDFDGDTPAYENISDHARRSVGAGLRALELAKQGNIPFSLMRPPGHHATQNRAMGFCYLNTIAITALEALHQGVPSVAILDFDVHHGNGTEAILVNRPNLYFASIHQHPCYPGTGTVDVGHNCYNYPLAPHTPRESYLKTIQKALKRLMEHQPALLGISAGFDAYAKDPIAQETLETEDFQELGYLLSQISIPTFHILEGGYSNDLPQLILAYLKGLSGKRP